MMSQTGKHTIATHILPTGNQTMKIGQLIKYNMRKNFLEKSYIKFGEKLLPDYFLKIKNISGSIV